MERWEKDFEWLRIRHYIKDSLGNDKLPDLQAVLFLIGVQELGKVSHEGFTKEEKQDLMHVAVCTLLEGEGYYEFVGRDQDGWPHWTNVKPFTIKGVDDQEDLIMEKIIQYFKTSL
jgi:hypothetical protein